MCSKNYIYTSKILFYDNPKLINTVGGKITPIGAGFDIGFMDKDGDAYNKIVPFEKWARMITGGIFILVGIYYCLAHIFGVQFQLTA